MENCRIARSPTSLTVSGTSPQFGVSVTPSLGGNTDTKGVASLGNLISLG